MSNEYRKISFFRQSRCCFDIVAIFGNNVAGFGSYVERNFVLSTKSKQTEHVQFMFKHVRLCRKDEISFDIVAKNGNNVEVIASVDRAQSGVYAHDKNVSLRI